MIKRIAVLVLCVVFFFCCAFTCAAVKFDGIPGNAEWADSQIYSFDSPDGFNNDVTFAYMRVIPNEESNQIYFCFSMRVGDISAPQNSAVLLSLNGGTEIYLGGTGDSPYNPDLYNIDYAMAYDNGACNIVYEVMLGVKYGIPAGSRLGVRLCDCNGIPSNAFVFTLDIRTDDESYNGEAGNQFSPSDTVKATTAKSKTLKSTVATTKKSAKNKTNKREKADDFTFNRVEINGNNDYISSSQSVSEKSTSTVNLTQKLTDNSFVKKNVLTAVGVVCAIAISGAAVYTGMKKANKKDDG